MKKRKQEPLKFQFGQEKSKMTMSRLYQAQIGAVMSLLANVGWKTIENTQWSNLTAVAPTFKQMAGDDKEMFLRYAAACLEIYSRWQHYTWNELEEKGEVSQESEIFTEDLEDFLKMLKRWQDENKNSLEHEKKVDLGSGEYELPSAGIEEKD